MADLTADKPADAGGHLRPGDDQRICDVASGREQQERRRRFWAGSAAGTIALLTIVAMWAISEYHDAGGWPTHGFSQNSGRHDVWNVWIIYPAIAWAFLTVGYAVLVFRRHQASVSRWPRGRHVLPRREGHRGTAPGAR